MNKATIAGGTVVILFIVVVLAVGYRTFEQDAAPTAATSLQISPATAAAHPSFLYGRITTVGGTTYKGRLRFGGDEEAFWGNYFNGFKDENPWAGRSWPASATSCALMPSATACRQPLSVESSTTPNSG